MYPFIDEVIFMREVAERAYNEELILLKDKKKFTAAKLSELSGININTIKSWLVNPLSAKWRKLDRNIFYLIKSKIIFIDDKNSLDQRGHTEFLSGLIDDALLLAKNSILSKQPLNESDLSFITQALEINGILRWRIDALIPQDKEEMEYLVNLKNGDVLPLSTESNELESNFILREVISIYN
jgi:hypothetical protein